MPKIIENAQALIFTAAKKNLQEKGGNFSLRGIAKECGISPGTVYNYFADKSSLIEAVMREDWNVIIDDVQKRCESAADMAEVSETILAGIREMAQRYHTVISSKDITENRFNPYGKYHMGLNSLIAELLTSSAKRLHKVFNEEDAAVLSELIIMCAQQPAISSEQIRNFVKKIEMQEMHS